MLSFVFKQIFDCRYSTRLNALFSFTVSPGSVTGLTRKPMASTS